MDDRIKKEGPKSFPNKLNCLNRMISRERRLKPEAVMKVKLPKPAVVAPVAKVRVLPLPKVMTLLEKDDMVSP